MLMWANAKNLVPINTLNEPKASETLTASASRNTEDTQMQSASMYNLINTCSEKNLHAARKQYKLPDRQSQAIRSSRNGSGWAHPLFIRGLWQQKKKVHITPVTGHSASDHDLAIHGKFQDR